MIWPSTWCACCAMQLTKHWYGVMLSSWPPLYTNTGSSKNKDQDRKKCKIRRTVGSILSFILHHLTNLLLCVNGIPTQIFTFPVQIILHHCLLGDDVNTMTLHVGSTHFGNRAHHKFNLIVRCDNNFWIQIKVTGHTNCLLGFNALGWLYQGIHNMHLRSYYVSVVKNRYTVDRFKMHNFQRILGRCLAITPGEQGKKQYCGLIKKKWSFMMNNCETVFWLIGMCFWLLVINACTYKM